MTTDTLKRAAKRDAAARLRAEQARADLLAEIDAAYTAGASVRAIAELTGLSFQRVYQLVTRPAGPGARPRGLAKELV